MISPAEVCCILPSGCQVLQPCLELFIATCGGHTDEGGANPSHPLVPAVLVGQVDRYCVYIMSNATTTD